MQQYNFITTMNNEQLHELKHNISISEAPRASLWFSKAGKSQ